MERRRSALPARRWPRRAAALLAVFAVAGSLAVIEAAPAAAWTHIGFYWGPAPQTVTYGFDIHDPRYQPFAKQAIETINYVADGRITFTPTAPGSIWSHQGLGYRMRIRTCVCADKLWAGKFFPIVDPNDGTRLVAGDAVYNTAKLDQWLAVPGGSDIVSLVGLHELLHGVGLYHTPLYTPEPPKAATSHCNVMYEAADPFAPDEPCNGMGSIMKPDDIEGLWARYPVPMPSPSCPTKEPARSICYSQMPGW